MSKIVDTSKTELRRRLIEDMGFSDKKAETYLCLLKMGEVTASQIAKNAGIKRTTVYNILPELLHDGLIKKYKSKKKTLYYVEDVHDLLHRIKERTIGVEKIIPDLIKLHTSKTSHPHVAFYEGRDGAIQLWKHMIDGLNPGDELLSILNSTNYQDILQQHILEYYTLERARKNCSHRIITNNSDYMKMFFKNTQNARREVKIVDSKELDFSSEIRIFGDTISVMSYDEDFMGVVIRSKHIANMHRVLFEKFWNSN